MPGKKGYASKAQRGYMHANHPEIAKRMDSETPKGKKLPQHSHHGKARQGRKG